MVITPLKPLEKRLLELQQTTATPNWDFENAPSIPPEDWKRALRLSQIAFALTELVPVPSPCGDGSVHLRWTRDDRQVVLELRGAEMLWSTAIAGNRSYGECASDQGLLDLLRETFV